jgi:hypothetical protein
MGLKKVITIEGKDITVRELLVGDILGIFDEGQNIGLGQLVGKFGDLLPKAVDCDADFLKSLAPSDVKTIYEAFREVNAVFFETAAAAGLPQILKSMRDKIVGNFSGVFSALLSGATGKPSGDIPGEIS